MAVAKPEPESAKDDAGSPQWRIKPTAATGNNEYSDICLSNLFAQHVNMLNVEKQLVWHRFTAMLLANSIILSLVGAQTRPPGNLDQTFVKLVCGIGMVLCVVWFIITSLGWSLTNKRLNVARKFTWEGYGNPIEAGIYPMLADGGNPDWIRLLSYAVIAIFFIGYLLLGVVV